MAQKAGQAPIQNPMSSKPEEIRLPVTPALESEVQLAEELRQKTELLKLSREAVLVVDLSDKIAFWSDGAEQLYGWKRADALGRSPLELLQTQLPRPVAQIETILRREPHWEGELKQTTRYGARISVSSRWALWRDLSGRTLGRFQLDSDITRRKNVEQELRVLSGRLLTIRDEERRRWARELHDSVGQLLVGITMNLSILQRQIDAAGPLDAKFLTESMHLTNEALQEIRTLSYLLHPPMLDEVGLASALRWFASGFSKRSEIGIDLEIPESLGRFPRDLEIAVFRIVQETLTNVHRHSGSSTAKITIWRSPNQLRLKVEDKGKGMTLPAIGKDDRENAILGVGISGIRERVRQLAGQMQIRSGDWGTALEAVFPLEEPDVTERSRGATED
ncbi:MAG TPA: PAS domain-containing sensor histidine kinase [Terriglobales bacterium]|nr:PAS domain-containing sensor histidine kinase [Terriglobales bacterium]